MADTNAPASENPQGTTSQPPGGHAFGPGVISVAPAANGVANGGASIELSGTASIRGGAALFGGSEDGGSKIGSGEGTTIEFRVTATLKGLREKFAGGEDGGHGIGHAELDGENNPQHRLLASQAYDPSKGGGSSKGS